MSNSIPQDGSFTMVVHTPVYEMVIGGKTFTPDPSFNIFKHNNDSILEEAKRQKEVDTIDSIDDLFCF